MRVLDLDLLACGPTVNLTSNLARYPQEIYTTILHHLGPDQRQLAVDVATGSGQVATDLASSFVRCVTGLLSHTDQTGLDSTCDVQCRVLATDPSQGQLDQASQAPGGNISYQQGRAEDIDLPDDSADLVTVAAGLHWFDFPVRRSGHELACSSLSALGSSQAKPACRSSTEKCSVCSSRTACWPTGTTRPPPLREALRQHAQPRSCRTA